MTDTLTNTLTLNSIRARIREMAENDAKAEAVRLSKCPLLDGAGHSV